MEGLLEPVFQENYLGRAEVRNSSGSSSGTVAGCYVVDGILKREAQIRVVRDGAVIYTSKLNSLSASRMTRAKYVLALSAAPASPTSTT